MFTIRYSQLYKIISRANTLFAHLGDVQLCYSFGPRYV